MASVNDRAIVHPNPAEVYRARLADRLAMVAVLAKRHDGLASGRLAVAALAVAIGWGAFGQGLWSAWWLAVPAAGFLGLAFVHDRVLEALDRARRAVGVYERGLSRIEDRWSGTGATGATYAPPDHPYAADLDLFGDGLLFQLLSAARLHAGEETLARWLLAPADLSGDCARGRRHCDDLRGRVDLREQLELTGESVSAWLDTTGLATWGAQPPVLSGRWPRVIAVGLALGNLATLVAGFAFGASPAWAALAVICSVAFSMAWRRRVHHVIASVNAPARHLRLLAEVLRWLSPRMCRRRTWLRCIARLAATGDTASHRIAQLTRLVDLLESRQNQMFAPIALLLLWGTQLAWAIETWRRRSGPSLTEWVAVAGEFEALCSLAGYAFEHPADPFADIVAGGRWWKASHRAPAAAGGSRRAQRRRTRPGRARAGRLRGRTCQGRARCCARLGSTSSWRSPVRRCARSGWPSRHSRWARRCASRTRCRRENRVSLRRSRDSGRSSIWQTARVPVLFLLDELLAGTNSHDRRLGAAGIVQGLVDKGAIGLVTTHDLALAEVVSDLGSYTRATCTSATPSRTDRCGSTTACGRAW